MSTLPAIGATVATTVCVARQRIEDTEGRTVGFEVLFRSHAQAASASQGWVFDDDRATAGVILAVTAEFDIQEVSGDGLLFVNVPRSFIVGDFPVALPAGSVVLEILERVRIDEDVLAGMDRLIEAGYTLALDDVVPGDQRLAFVDRCAFVKIDLHDVPDPQLGQLVAQIRELAPGALVVAERVETAEDMAVARAAGCELFQGYLINRPSLLVRESVRSSAPIATRILAELGDPSVAMSQIAELILMDAAIARRVLRHVNAVEGARVPVTDVVQALTLLGPQRLQALLVLDLIGATGHQDPEIPLSAVARTTAAQVLAPGEPLLAAVESLARMCMTVLGMSAAEVAEWLPRPPRDSAAVRACDALDRYLEAVDHGVEPVLPSGYEPLEISVAWLEGLRHARELLGDGT